MKGGEELTGRTQSIVSGSGGDSLNKAQPGIQTTAEKRAAGGERE